MLIEINSNVEECPFRTLFLFDEPDRFHACGVMSVRCEREVPAMCPLLYGPVTVTMDTAPRQPYKEDL
jgi:hypothetical protein